MGCCADKGHHHRHHSQSIEHKRARERQINSYSGEPHIENIEDPKLREFVENFFNHFDTNRDGKLTYQEVKAGMQERAQSQNMHMTSFEINERTREIMAADLNQNDEVSKDQFYRYVKKCKQSQQN